MDSSHHYRFSEYPLCEALLDTPVVLIHGVRQCGKTTLAKSVGARYGYEYVSFDDLNHLRAAKVDPVGFVADLPEKVVLDEIQRTPELFATIKASVDENRKPGRFILTGSANVLLLPRLSDSLAGRMEIIRLRPLAWAEVAGEKPDFLAQLFSGRFSAKPTSATYTRLGEDLSELICRGGFPPVIKRQNPRRRSAWYRSYITTIVQRDVQDIANVRNLDVLPRLISLAASQTARLFVSENMAGPFSLSRPTIREYLALLEQMFLIERLQPWHSNRLSRLIKTPKMHFSDTGLAAALLGLNSRSLWNQKPLLGQLLETFVYNELRKHADWHDQVLDFYHFRNKDKVEVDFVIQQGGQVAGIEVKASSTVNEHDFKGLKKLREVHEEDFRAGILFYDGESQLQFGDRLFAVPIASLVQGYTVSSD